MIGEIRDKETGTIAIEAALTGHLVLSTLHTNDAPSAITRLTEMGIEPFLSASAITLVVAQRLARRLCPECKEPYMPEAGRARPHRLPVRPGPSPDAVSGARLQEMRRHRLQGPDGRSTRS